MLWSIVLNAFRKLIRTIPVRRSESKPFMILSWRYDKQVSVEWNFLKPDWYLHRKLLSGRMFIVWSRIIHSITLEINGSSEMGLKFFGSILRPFLYKGLIFATLHLSGKEASLMERLQILAIGVQSVFEPCLRNLPARLSTPVALTVCYYHVTYMFKSESTLYSSLNVKELLAQNSRDIWSLSDCSRIGNHKHLVRKPTLNHLASFVSLARWLSVRLQTKWLWVWML